MKAITTFALGSIGIGVPELLPRRKHTLGSRGLSSVQSNPRCKRKLQRACARAGPPTRIHDASRGTFVQPQRLFPIEEGVSTSGRSPEKEVGGSSALYFLTLTTSQDDNSDISEPNVGIMVSLIGENGKAILKTVPPVDIANPSRFQTRFQAGSKDNDVFVATDLDRLAALWIAPEKGTWTPAQTRVIVLQWNKEFDKIDTGSRRDLNTLLELMSNILDQASTAASAKKWKGYVYLFDSNEKRLGVGDESLAAELKPSFIREYSDPASMREALLGSSIRSGKTPASSYLSREEIDQLRALSMKDYEALKLQFLGISSLLVGVGTAGFAFLGEDRLTESFAVGGLGGFLYLLLLQRFVDQLPGPDSVTTEEKTTKEEGQTTGFTGMARLPVSVALVAGIAVLVGRISNGGAVSSMTPQMLVAGIAGFLTSRVAVIVASLRAKSSSENDQQ
ncbi:hypothetical protein R1flu_019454 [Riccia fluitans]|uniref:DUF7755 domain-containing protein n=1 Tax=Riccia fluitans TaxID=41844 RepID=A0ABD1ZK93_9MARC